MLSRLEGLTFYIAVILVPEVYKSIGRAPRVKVARLKIKDGVLYSDDNPITPSKDEVSEYSTLMNAMKLCYKNGHSFVSFIKEEEDKVVACVSLNKSCTRMIATSWRHALSALHDFTRRLLTEAQLN